MNYFERRRIRKHAQEALHHARVARAMVEDVTDPSRLERMDTAMDAVVMARKAGDWEALRRATDALMEAVETVRPRPADAHFRENFDVLIVAIVIAMGIRTYFVQPFRIPTGSMQPTLCGVQVRPQMGGKWFDRVPFRLVPLVIFGEKYEEVRAQASGVVGYPQPAPGGDASLLYVDRVPHKIRDRLPVWVEPGQFVRRGQVLASGRVTIGDHVLVNKVRYNFSRPRRGDIIVFETKNIDYPSLQGDFYIKRLAGLPGEHISIHPPHLIVNGSPVEQPMPFYRLVHDSANYAGYHLAAPASPRPKLLIEADDLALEKDQYLPLGDNTRSSLDGRYFGPVRKSALVGPAGFVYWPVSKRWGVVR